MVKGKCDNCSKKATKEYLVRSKNACHTLKFCEKCKPTYHYSLRNMTLIS